MSKICWTSAKEYLNASWKKAKARKNMTMQTIGKSSRRNEKSFLRKALIKPSLATHVVCLAYDLPLLSSFLTSSKLTFTMMVVHLGSLMLGTSLSSTSLDLSATMAGGLVAVAADKTRSSGMTTRT